MFGEKGTFFFPNTMGHLLQFSEQIVSMNKPCDNLEFFCRALGVRMRVVVAPLKCFNSHRPSGICLIHVDMRTRRMDIGTSDVQDGDHWIHVRSSLYKLPAEVPRYALLQYRLHIAVRYSKANAFDHFQDLKSIFPR